jgi:integrase
LNRKHVVFGVRHTIAVVEKRVGADWSHRREIECRVRVLRKNVLIPFELRPLTPKTVRDIPGVVSSSFARAIKWGLVSSNPVGPSEPPVPKRRNGLALNPSQQRLLIESASGCWCLPTFLELAAATGARRGELLALCWSDVCADALSISRSLSQTRAGLSVKETKNQSARLVILPDSAILALKAHDSAQKVFREEFAQKRTRPDLRRTRRDSANAEFNFVVGIAAFQTA